MAKLKIPLLTLGQSLKVEQATQIGTRDLTGACGGCCIQLVGTHSGRNSVELGRKRTTEATADFLLPQGYQFVPQTFSQQPVILSIATGFPSAGAAGVVSGSGRVDFRLKMDALSSQESAEFVGAGCHGPGSGCPFSIIGQQPGVVEADHAGAGTGRYHHEIISLQHCNLVPGHLSRLPLQSVVIARLAAASLGFRHIDLKSRLFQHLHTSKPDAWSQAVNKAGHEKGNAGAGHGQNRLGEAYGFHVSKIPSAMALILLRVAPYTRHIVCNNRTTRYIGA